MMDNYNVGDEIVTQFNLSGRLWSGAGKPEKCFTSLQAWRIASASGQTQGAPSDGAMAPAPPFDDNEYDDIPF